MSQQPWECRHVGEEVPEIATQHLDTEPRERELPEDPNPAMTGGRVAYETYSAASATEYLMATGMSLPPWDECRYSIQSRWEKVAIAVTEWSNAQRAGEQNASDWTEQPETD